MEADEVPEPYRSSLKISITAMVWEDLGNKVLDRTYNVWIDDRPEVVSDLVPSDQTLDGMSSALLFELLPFACRMAMGVWMRNRQESRWLYRAHELARRMANMQCGFKWHRYESLMLLSYCYLHQGFYESEQGAGKDILGLLNEGCKLKHQALALLEKHIADGSKSERYDWKKKLVRDRLFLANNLVRKVIIQVRHAHTTMKSDVDGDIQAAIGLAKDVVNDGSRLTVENVTLLGTLSAWLIVLNETTAIETIILAAVKAFPNFIFKNLNQEDHVRQMTNLYMLGSQSELEAQLDFSSLSQQPQGTSSPNEKYLGPGPAQDTRAALTEERPAHRELSDPQLSPFGEQDLGHFRNYTVVVINTTWAPLGSHALIIRDGKIDNKPVPLPDAPQGQIEERLPLHAAGDCKLASRNSALDWVISSYIPSVKVLLELHRSRESHKVERALLVSVSDSGEHSSLVHSRSEVVAVKNKLERTLLNASDVQILHNPTKKDFIDLVKHSQIFHFAGHGQAHPVDPSQSYLVLPNKERLTGEDLVATGTTEARPWLAYLSACSTGRTYEERLMNESSHLNSAFLLAGFRHVVGTLWQVSDLHSQKLASLFYSNLEDTFTSVNGNGVALALNLATRQLRNKLAGQLDEANVRCGTALADRTDDVETYSKQPAPVVDDHIQYVDDAMRYLEDWRDLGSKRKNQKYGGKAPDKAYFTWTAYIHMGL
ncbi:hypothetical protein SLS63_009071 [Diaporthe eres]|uniref:CHAT domain-containing protein n=1 Tax=Diaporthe eres TaxID=83184 RepID=A0ABR1P0X2_DIAER